MTDATPPSIPPPPSKGRRTVTSRTVPTESASVSTAVAEEPVVAEFAPAFVAVPEPEPTGSASRIPLPEVLARPVDPMPAEPALDTPDGPTPLATAVEATTGWLKRVGHATSSKVTSAYQSAAEADAQGATAGAAAQPVETVGTAASWPVGSPTTTSGPVSRPASGPRRVRLVTSRVDPWSVLKLSLLLSFALGIMGVVAAAVLWLTLNGLGVFADIKDLVTQVADPDTAKTVMAYFAFPKTIAAAMLIGVIDVFLLTALGTIGAFLYNIVASLVGGLHVTMTDE